MIVFSWFSFVKGHHVEFVLTMNIKELLAVLKHDEFFEGGLIENQMAQTGAAVVDIKIIRDDDAAAATVLKHAVDFSINTL